VNIKEEHSGLADNIRENVLQFIREYSLIEKGELVLCAVSGGVDSMVMMDLLSEISAEVGFAMHIAHFDHGLRGADGALDRELVEGEALSRGLSFSHGKGDVREFMRQEGLGLEEAARNLRYDFLFNLKESTGAHKVATAHHADDQVETILMRLLRGTGLKGLSGIKAMDSRGLIRPFLTIKKSEILEFSLSNGISYREDPTNRQLITLRNVIRNNLIPTIEVDHRERFQNNIVSLAEMAGEATEYLEELVGKLYLESILSSNAQEIKLDLKKLRGYHYFLRTELCRYAYRKLRGYEGELSRKASKIFAEFCERGQSGKKVQLPGGISVIKSFDTISLVKRREKADAPVNAPLRLEPGIYTECTVGDNRFRIDVRCEEVVDTESFLETMKVEGGKYLGCFDHDKLVFPLRLRGWLKGDRMSPFGLNGSKRVSDLLLEARIPREMRNSVPILTDRERILWVVGVRRSSHAIVSRDTRCVIVMEVLQEEGGNA
jgi:tRNA(Ile)-lysidine synthase